MLSWMRRKGTQSKGAHDPRLAQIRAWAPKASVVAQVNGVQGKKARARKALAEQIFTELPSPLSPSATGALGGLSSQVYAPSQPRQMGGAS